ncbi:hypothetical protein AB0N07_49360 [Streptomyces sp. NPDC051172]|uniref:hypothetical protein n=1 Tax=Streptomyces sp. NPDC051172 TaxID=3155796 RepID=UPI00341A6E30
MGLKPLLQTSESIGQDWSETLSPEVVTWIDEELYRREVATLPICCVDVFLVRAGRTLLIRRRDEPQARRL